MPRLHSCAARCPLQVVEQAEARPGDYAAVWADPAKIQRELGWSARFTDIEAGLGHAWAWRKRHPTGYGSAGPLQSP